MLRIGYQVAVGGSTLAPGDASSLQALETETSLGVPVNACVLRLHGSTALTAAAGDPVTVDLGYGDSLERVFTGTVAAVEWGLVGMRVEALGSFAALVAARLNQVYEKQTAGAIASDLLGRAGVAEGTVEDGPKFAILVVDEASTAWAHLHGLARRCGFLLYADEQDRAHFRAYAPAATHAFSYGVDVLEVEHEARPAEFAGVEVYGASPAGQGQGEDASSWLTKKQVRGSAGGSDGRVLRVADPAARNPNLAGDIARGLLATYGREAEGRVRVIGAAAVRLGDAVRLERLPSSGYDGEYRITAVRHRLHPRTGFVTDISWRKDS